MKTNGSLNPDANLNENSEMFEDDIQLANENDDDSVITSSNEDTPSNSIMSYWGVDQAQVRI